MKFTTGIDGWLTFRWDKRVGGVGSWVGTRCSWLVHGRTRPNGGDTWTSPWQPPKFK
jgi:hypothetical protein